MSKVKMLIVVLVVMLMWGTLVLAQDDAEPVEMEFVNDLAMGIPAQDVYIDANLETVWSCAWAAN